MCNLYPPAESAGLKMFALQWGEICALLLAQAAM
jgi:hypothetical protein